MRSIPGEFLGALLGAWIGVSTKIWEAPPLSIVSFVVGLVAIALLLGILSGNEEIKNKTVRYLLISLLIVIALLIGVVFTYHPQLSLLDVKHLWFFYIVILCWLLVSFLTPMIRRGVYGEGEEGI